MGKLVYRMCLFVILVIAVAGGVYYYMTIYQKEDNMDNGTFVKNMNRVVQRADKDIIEPALDGIQGRMAEACAYVDDAVQQAVNTGRETIKQAEYAGKDMLTHAEQAGKDMLTRAEYAGKDMLTHAEQAGKDMLTHAGRAGKDVLAHAEQAGKDVLARAERAGKDMFTHAEQV